MIRENRWRSSGLVMCRERSAQAQQKRLSSTPTFAMVAATGDIYAGLWYPVGVAALTLVVGLLFLPETFRRRVDHAA